MAEQTAETDAIEALADRISGCLSNVSDLPKWMQIHALGRDTRPLLILAARAVIAAGYRPPAPVEHWDGPDDDYCPACDGPRVISPAWPVEHSPIWQQGEAGGYWCSCGYASCDLDHHAEHVRSVTPPSSTGGRHG